MPARTPPTRRNLHADYFSAYRKYIGAHNVLAQFCLAHFIRDALFLKRFVTTPDVDPTNNLAEQALRFTVLNRRMTQGTRSPNGHRGRETLWTIAQTCTQQGRSFYHFLVEALSAHFAQRPLPSLLPAGP